MKSILFYLAAMGIIAWTKWPIMDATTWLNGMAIGVLLSNVAIRSVAWWEERHG